MPFVLVPYNSDVGCWALTTVPFAAVGVATVAAIDYAQECCLDGPPRHHFRASRAVTVVLQAFQSIESLGKAIAYRCFVGIAQPEIQFLNFDTFPKQSSVGIHRTHEDRQVRMCKLTKLSFDFPNVDHQPPRI